MKRKMFAILLALVMLLSVGVPALAVETPEAANAYKITLISADGAYSDQALKDKGGVPGRVNVMWQGRCIAFPDAQPEIKNDRTMIPVRTVLESLDATVDYLKDTKGVKITMKDTSVTFPIGSTTATVTDKDGKETTIQMDCASYLKVEGGESRTMVPLRFLSEACGYDVLWDQGYRTATVVDRDQLIAKLDAKLTKLNALLQSDKLPQQDKVRQDLSFTLKVGIKDAETGKTTDLTVSGTVTAYSEGAKAYLDGTLDLTDLYKYFLENAEPGDTSFAEMMAALKADPAHTAFQLLLDEKGDLYFHMPLLNDLSGLDKATWIELGSFGTALTALTAQDLRGVTVGQVVVPMMAEAMKDQGFSFYDTMDYLTAVYTAMYGDDSAKQVAGGYTWSFDTKGFVASLGLDQETAAAVSGVLSGMTCVVTLKEDGSASFDFALKGSEDGLAFDAALSMTATTASGKLDASLSLDYGELGGALTLRLTGESTTKTDATMPSFTLPAGAVVKDIAGLGL